MCISDLSAVSIAVFAVLVLAGGVMGFTKGKSKASLIAGIISSALLIWCANSVYHRSSSGTTRALLFIAILEGIFVVRLLKTKKFMPAGLMLILCLVEQVFLLWTTSH